MWFLRNPRHSLELALSPARQDRLKALPTLHGQQGIFDPDNWYLRPRATSGLAPDPVVPERSVGPRLCLRHVTGDAAGKGFLETVREDLRTLLRLVALHTGHLVLCHARVRAVGGVTGAAA